MHVLVVTVVHHPEDARILHRQIASLAVAGHEISYAAPFEATGVDQRRVPGVRTAIDLPRAVGRNRRRALGAARSTMGRVDADISILHDPELLLGVRRDRPHMPIVWDVHEDTAAAVEDKPWLLAPARPVARRVMHAVERWAEQHVHLLLAEHAYQRRFADAHAVVPNVPRLPDTAVTIGMDRVVYVGRVSARRGARDLAALAAALRPDRITVDVIGAIDEDVEADLRRAEAAGGLVLHGMIPNDRALAMLDGALAGLSLLHDEPNYRHSMPTKVLEYAAAGLPVITTPLPLAAEVAGTIGGTVVPFQDPAGAATAIRRLRAAPGHAAALGAAGREHVARHYSWDVEGPRFVSLIEQWAA